MKRIFPSIFLFFPSSLILLIFVSCGPATLVEIGTPTSETAFEVPAISILNTSTPSPGSTCGWEEWPCPSDSLTLTAAMEPTLNALLTGTPVCTWPCPEDSLTLTAAMEPTLNALLTGTPVCTWPCPEDSLTLTAAMRFTLTAIPISTSPTWATIIPAVGDLGWGSVHGRIIDRVSNLPIEGATVKCEHFSYTSPYLCNGITTTNADGIYAFTGVFFHDTDRITLFVEAPGFDPLRFEQAFFTRPEFHADLGLILTSADTTPTPTSTPTPYLMCTPPACSGGRLVCGSSNGCLGGCGTICLMETPTP